MLSSYNYQWCLSKTIQQAHGVKTTPYRRHDVTLTLKGRCFKVMCLLGMSMHGLSIHILVERSWLEIATFRLEILGSL